LHRPTSRISRFPGYGLFLTWSKLNGIHLLRATKLVTCNTVSSANRIRSSARVTSLRVRLPEAISILADPRPEARGGRGWRRWRWRRRERREEEEAGGYTRAYKQSRHEIRWESASGARLMLSTRTHVRTQTRIHMSRRACTLCPSGPPSLRSLIFANAAPVFYLNARAGILYMDLRRRSAVVPGGIRDDTSPMSPHRLGMLRRLSRRTSIYRSCASINGEPRCQIVCFRGWENDEIIFITHFRGTWWREEATERMWWVRDIIWSVLMFFLLFDWILFLQKKRG